MANAREKKVGVGSASFERGRLVNTGGNSVGSGTRAPVRQNINQLTKRAQPQQRMKQIQKRQSRSGSR